MKMFLLNGTFYKWAILILFVTGVDVGSSWSETVFYARELSFVSVFAQRQGDDALYCLLGNGFIQSPRSDETNQIISAWIALHPLARVVLIDTFTDKGFAPTINYIWIEDSGDNLNVQLVRQGAVPGSVMFDMVDFVRSIPEETRQTFFAHSVPKRLVETDRYEKFITQISEAEIAAKVEKKGIWGGGHNHPLESGP